MADSHTPTIEEWRRLYQAAIEVKKLAPWEWMEELDIFGVEDPETGELGFVSVMGALGEHYAIAVYLGPVGLNGFWHLQDMGPEIDAESFFQIPQLQASFEDRKELDPSEREIIKKLGLKFRGRQAWPQFRSFRPGFAPWFVEAEEARFLTAVLEQTLDVAPRFREDTDLLEPPDDDSYLVRVPHREGDKLIWEDQVMQTSLPEAPTISLKMNTKALEQLKRLPRGKTTLEIDLFILPIPMREEADERPYFAYNLLLVDAKSGMVLGQELLSPYPSLEDMWGLVPMHTVQKLANLSIRPKEVRVRTALMSQVLQPLAGELGFKLKLDRWLPHLEEAKEFMLARFG